MHIFVQLLLPMALVHIGEMWGRKKLFSSFIFAGIAPYIQGILLFLIKSGCLSYGILMTDKKLFSVVNIANLVRMWSSQ